MGEIDVNRDEERRIKRAVARGIRDHERKKDGGCGLIMGPVAVVVILAVLDALGVHFI
ncbi:hypothetical protein V2J94_14330 [Streptomyces sp. DSM 41524]|uniref:Uncharacterized protein n=1 Tax=Streptomyces asiaticus subsp. ignotus TaxID=3098222 RepID=A0ABU7PVD4_9ACTN|nr:hypothetical protein [Streptomyces sp. PRh5]MEE4593053.1 hypothetical protein [Streptomyces sp. DSM 41524]